MSLAQLRSVSHLRPLTLVAHNPLNGADEHFWRGDLAIERGELVPRATLVDCPNCMTKYNSSDSDAHIECADGLELCMPCAIWMDACEECGEMLATAGDWDMDNCLHFWQLESDDTKSWCSACRGEGMVECTVELGERNPFAVSHCPTCTRDYSLEHAIPDGYTDDPLCPRCSAPCSLCARQVLCNGESGVRNAETLRVRCALCVTPECSVCNDEVGLVGQMCFATGPGKFTCVACVGDQK